MSDQPSPQRSADPAQSPPPETTFDPATLAAGLAILDAWDAMGELGREFHAALEGVTELRLGQVRLLRTLSREPMPTDQLAARLGEHPDAVAASVRSLEQLGLLGVTAATDSRQAVATVSPPGRVALDRASGLLVGRLTRASAQTQAGMLAAIEAAMAPLRRLEQWLQQPGTASDAADR